MEALVNHLSTLLKSCGHFNIDTELAIGNIKKIETSLATSLSNNPYVDEHTDSISPTFTINLLRDKDSLFSENLEQEYKLLESYKALWNDDRRSWIKGKRGRNRQKLHRELFNENIAPLLKKHYSYFEIDDGLNICFITDGRVEFVNNFIDIIRIFENLETHDGSLFFRGHSNSSYRLIPSIYRGAASFYEREMLYDTMNLLPEEVNDAPSTFEILTKLQHFGTPTRLLDLTTNPLVALFFSCMEPSFHGEVLCFKVKKDKVKLFDSDTVSILANLSKMPNNFDIRRILGLSKAKFNDEKQIRELVHKIRNEKSYFENVVVPTDLDKSFFVTSKLNNPRIIRQSGAFIVCGMNGTKLSPSPEIYEIERRVIKRILIGRTLKKSIKKSLDVFNISSGSLFPDLSEVSRYIKSKYGL